MNRMLRWASFGLALCVAPWLASCASAPPYTLYSLAGPAPVATGTHGAALRIEVLTPGVPAQVRHPQFVVGDDGGALHMVEDSRWAGPLDQEIAAALSLDLTGLLDAVDVARTAQAGGEARYRIDTDVVRFESMPGDHVAIEVTWTVRRVPGDEVLACRSAFREAVGPGYAAMVEGHRRALDKVAAAIAAGVGQVRQDRLQCPA